MVANPLIPGARCLVRIVARLIHDENQYGYKVDYMGSVLLVPRAAIVTVVSKTMVLLEIECRMIRVTGRASFLVEYAGHALRVHVQQMRAESEVARW